MNVLVVGSGGREHALCWKLASSPLLDRLFCAPGNAGIESCAECTDIAVDDFPALIQFAKENKIGLTVVGPEAPLIAGLADAFHGERLKVFGPVRAAAAIEGSKAFSKKLMRNHGVVTAEFRTFNNVNAARGFVQTHHFPLVVKADGNAAGKGVFVCHNIEEALSAIDQMMLQRVFGDAGDTVVIEEFLQGEEVSILALTDGRTIYTLEASQDHKPVFDGDKGPNTGGMGAYSPVPVVTEKLLHKVETEILVQTVHAMKLEGCDYEGLLYAGLIIADSEPKVLEFNCRFGDPEAQPLMMRLKSDLLPPLLATVEGRLDSVAIEWDERAAVCVVMASGGYPGKYEKGKPIEGLEDVEKMADVVVFHAGTRRSAGEVVTNGGRVLGVTALGATIGEAKKRAYEAVSKIGFEGAQYRKDIADKAIARM